MISVHQTLEGGTKSNMDDRAVCSGTPWQCHPVFYVLSFIETLQGSVMFYLKFVLVGSTSSNINLTDYAN